MQNETHYGVFTERGRCLMVTPSYDNADRYAALHTITSGTASVVSVMRDTPNRGVFRCADMSTHIARGIDLWKLNRQERRRRIDARKAERRAAHMATHKSNYTLDGDAA